MKIFASSLITIFLVGTIKAKNDCVSEEKTWSIEGQLEFLPQSTLQECLNAFLQNQDGQALTYFGNHEDSRFDQVCIIFGKLDGERSCTNCLSIKGDYTNDNCLCNQVEGECQIEEDNFLQALSAKSELQCSLQCSINDRCKYYTWFSNENEDVSDECLLFSSCQTINECNGGCYVGQVDCNEPTTMTTDTTTTPTLPTTVPDLCNDNTYLVLDDPKRNMNFAYDEQFCDNSDSNHESPDWRGPNWYRVVSPAGSKIPETDVEPRHCNTFATGWLNGTHPSIPHEVVSRTICFHSLYPENNCGFKTDVQIRNCGEYFLYYLSEVPDCMLRYCSE